MGTALLQASTQYLDALFELVAGCGRAFSQQLTEDHDLLEQEDSSFLRAGQDAGVLHRNKKGFLLQQFALTGQFPLQRNQVDKNITLLGFTARHTCHSVCSTCHCEDPQNLPQIPAADPNSSCHYTVSGPETSNLLLSVKVMDRDI